MGYAEGNFGIKTYQIRGSLLAVVIPSQAMIKYHGRCRDLMVGTLIKLMGEEKVQTPNPNLGTMKIVVVSITWRFPVRVRVPQPSTIR
jgi:hypothetical protein